jgi:hypothetical protein
MEANPDPWNKRKGGGRRMVRPPMVNSADVDNTVEPLPTPEEHMMKRMTFVDRIAYRTGLISTKRSTEAKKMVQKKEEALFLKQAIMRQEVILSDDVRTIELAQRYLAEMQDSVRVVMENEEASDTEIMKVERELIFAFHSLKEAEAVHNRSHKQFLEYKKKHNALKADETRALRKQVYGGLHKTMKRMPRDDDDEDEIEDIQGVMQMYAEGIDDKNIYNEHADNALEGGRVEEGEDDELTSMLINMGLRKRGPVVKEVIRMGPVVIKKSEEEEIVEVLTNLGIDGGALPVYRVVGYRYTMCGV